MTKKKTDTAKSPKPSKTQESIENTSPDSPVSFPIVGIGASAGGLAAFEAFFSGMPALTDPGMAFVLVQHLAPDHKSILSDLIRRYTRMQVFEVEDGMTVRPNCAYIIPPGRDMAFLGGTLQLMEPLAPRGQRMPIDFFFQSLALDQGDRAICIVLSGTGSDGTHGVRVIKAEGGMVMAQTIDTTEYDGMPRSAIATGLVDYELPPAEMPAQIIAYVTHAFGKHPKPHKVFHPKTENALKKIFILLRAQTGHDFSQYKPNTINRRIERRMAVHQIDTIDRYVKYLQKTPGEVEALFRDMLIGVTSFFRDSEAFKTIEKLIIPKLFENKSENAVIRIWSPGCSTGEEAYSLAILLAEHQEVLKRSFMVQVFATDIDSQAIATARAGLYPAGIVADVSPERLARFFTLEPGGDFYRIHKSIRDMLVFSEQDVIKDPPFSKLDLISCRNLLIYMGGDLQKKLIPLFHYALNPGGVLFLGTSETIGDCGDLFSVLDRKMKMYQRKDDFHGLQRVPLGRILPPMMAMGTRLPKATGKIHDHGKMPLRTLTEQALLQQVAPGAVLVNGKGDILYLHGRTGMFLEPTPGEAGVNNILKMAREGLQRDLTTALHKVVAGRDIVRYPDIRVKTNGDFTMVNLTVRTVAPGPAEKSDDRLFLVILEESPAVEPEQLKQGNLLPTGADDSAAVPESGSGPDSGTSTAIGAAKRIVVLEQELRARNEYIQTTHEELETSNEELKSSNEEMQSVNEELQSTNEELETSKEELQSVNEELSTVNAELQTKVADLSTVNNDMNNLLAGTGIATVFVDHSLRILRFTPGATKIINLIQSDIGRPVSHILSNLKGYDKLTEDMQTVLETLIAKEVDVQTNNGLWYTMRTLPYRTLNNVIEGVVVTFVEVTEAKTAQKSLQKSIAILNETGGIAKIGGWELDIGTGFSTWTDEVFRIFELDLNRSHEPLLPDALNFYSPDSKPIISKAVQRASEHGEPYDLVLELITKKGNHRWVHTTGRANQEDGKIKSIGGTIQDITERKLAEAALHEKNIHMAEAIVATVREPLLVLDAGLHVLLANPAFYSSFQVIPAATLGRLVYELGNRQWDIPELRKLLQEILPQKTVLNDYEITHTFEHIGLRTMRLNARRIINQSSQPELILLAIDVGKGEKT